MPYKINAKDLTLTYNARKTAIRRNKLSRPTALALVDKIITKDTTVFDYGCGLGDDIKFLLGKRIVASGWDPFYYPRNPIKKADVVTLNYVLNVLQFRSDRIDVLQQAFSLARKALVVAVRVEKPPQNYKRHRDGHVSSRGTFQKFWTQKGFKQFIRSAQLDSVSQIIEADKGVLYLLK